MKLIDLNNNKNVELFDDCDICIVGSGAAGLFLTECLSKSGLKIILLDAGNKVSISGEKVGMKCKFSSKVYNGATIGRFFGVGGSTSEWGGRLIPFPDSDSYRSSLDSTNSDSWNNIISTVNKYQDSVLDILDLQNISFKGDVDKILRNNSNIFPNIEVTSSVFLPFSKKNFSFMVKKWSLIPISLYYNAVVSNYNISRVKKGDSEINSIEAVSINGNKVKINSKRFIIASGAIESTRMLLEMEESVQFQLFKKTATIGNYLSDHLSWRIFSIKKDFNSKVVGLFSHKFINGLMRSIHFINAGKDGKVPRYYAHLVFDNKSIGFKLARDVLYFIQNKRIPRIAIKDFLFGISDLFKIVFFRFFAQRLYISPKTETSLFIDVEQDPVKENSISLSDEIDNYGRKIVNINWNITNQDLLNIECIARNFDTHWNEIDSLVGANGKSIERVDADMRNPHDVYHPVGTCKMGKGKEDVVDFNLKVYGTSNLYVLSTAVFPTAGSANPTFSMLCFAKKMADNIVRSFNVG
jgi:hypothetical protein